MSEMKSTVSFKSNLQLVREEKICDDKDFLSSVRDPFGLEKMRQQKLRLTRIQAIEFNRVSMHCAYAFKDDYPFGTVLDEYGNEKVVCKCLNSECSRFSQCRPDFSPDELRVCFQNINLKDELSRAIASFDEESTAKDSQDGDKEAASQLYNNLEEATEETDILADRQTPADNESETQINYELEEIAEIDVQEDVSDASFSSFAVVEQEKIIHLDSKERTIVNAGPGTGKTWTLIEKIKYMLSEEEVDPENILVLCFSRAAVDVIRTRLKDASDSGELPLNWHMIETRTFDSFVTYMLAVLMDNFPDMLPEHYSLEGQDYDARIKTAVDVFKMEKDMLGGYSHVIVDEVQDLVGLRAELVLAILEGLPDSCGFTLLGDSCQALYDYLAANDQNVLSSTEFYKRLFHMFPDVNYFALDINYRQGDELGDISLPYRQAILSENSMAMAEKAYELYSKVKSSTVDLRHFTIEVAEEYRKKGTVGILTRTNGQALQISAWMRTEGVDHQLRKRAGTGNLAAWIYKVIFKAETEVLGRDEFMSIFNILYPNCSEQVDKYWNALISPQKNTTANHYEIEDLLCGLLQNPQNSLLYDEPSKNNLPVFTVSNIHRAKGCEFDTVLVIEDVISQMGKSDQDDDLEHKVCYVAVTRPKKDLEKVKLTNKYIFIMKDESRRCFRRGGHPGKFYLSHFEVGDSGDLDERSFAVSVETQDEIRNVVKSGDRLKLLKCPKDTKDNYFVYRIVPEDNEKVVLGYTSRKFYVHMYKAIQRVFNNYRQIDYKYFPGIFNDVYVDGLTTCISSDGSNIDGARQYGNMYIWSGISISGFAQMEKDRY